MLPVVLAAAIAAPPRTGRELYELCKIRDPDCSAYILEFQSKTSGACVQKWSRSGTPVPEDYMVELGKRDHSLLVLSAKSAAQQVLRAFYPCSGPRPPVAIPLEHHIPPRPRTPQPGTTP